MRLFNILFLWLFTDRFLEAKTSELDESEFVKIKFNPFDVSTYKPDFDVMMVVFKNGQKVQLMMSVEEFEVLLNSVKHT
jgi:hypothetical protein